MTKEEIIRMLNQLADEVRGLRRHNEVLSAQVDVVEVFRAALLGPPRNGGMAEDIAWRAGKMVEALDALDLKVSRPAEGGDC